MKFVDIESDGYSCLISRANDIDSTVRQVVFERLNDLGIPIDMKNTLEFVKRGSMERRISLIGSPR